MNSYLRLTQTAQYNRNGLQLLKLAYVKLVDTPQTTRESVSIVDVIKHYRNLDHQETALLMLEKDLKANPYNMVMSSQRPWYRQWAQKGNIIAEYIFVVSGAPNRQFFRVGADSRSGSLEPLPEGEWEIDDIAWASGKPDDWGASWGPGLGPVSVPLQWRGPGRTSRSSIEIHIDWNGRTSPGTAGCIGVENQADMRKLIRWLRDTDPRRLYVDWGLGSCPRPSLR